MSTPPIQSELLAIEKRIGTFFDLKHIVLVLGLAAALFATVYFIEDRKIAVAEGKAAVATAVAKQAADDALLSAEQNKTLQAQKDAVISTLTAANTTLAQANQTLSMAMKAQAAALAAQQEVDKKMTPTQQSARWTALVPTAVVVPIPDGFQVNSQGGIDTLLQLEQVPVLKSTVEKLNASLDNANHTVSNDAGILAAEKAEHQSDLDNDGKQLVASQAETKKVQSDFDVYKKKAHRSIMRAYVAGIATGVVIRKVLGF